MSILSVHHATLGYHDLPVLRNISFAVSAGSVCCLLGANGCGKTTLMRTLLGVIPLIEGQMLLDSKSVHQMSARQRASAIAWVPQAQHGGFSFTVLEMVLMGFTPYMTAFSIPGATQRDNAIRQLDDLGISHLSRRNWNTLSGGERQLVLIARALVQKPRLLLLDEPASSLDFGHQVRLLDTIHTLKRCGMTILMSTHHPLHARTVADSVVCVEPDGQVTQGPANIQLTPARLAALYRVPLEQIHHHLYKSE